MSIEPAAQDGRHSPTSAAERMRAVRKRRRLGSYLVRVQLDELDIDGLVRLRLLKQSMRKDPEALQVSRLAGRLECHQPIANLGHAL